MTNPASTTPVQLGRDGAAALQIVSEAADLMRTVQDDVTGAAFTKSDASPVTIADFAVQALVAARLARDAPDDPLVAEEDAASLRASEESRRGEVTGLVRRVIPDAREEQVLEWIDRGKSKPDRRFWTLDPIDGTNGLIHGRQYVIALALIVDGMVQVGVIGCPRLALVTNGDDVSVKERASDGGLAFAVRGRGAWWTSGLGTSLVPLAVSHRRDPPGARVMHSHEEEHGDVGRFERALRALGIQAPPLLMDSQAKQVTLSAGAADLLMRFPKGRDFHDAIWDYAAGSLLIEEAGGRVSDLAGRPLDFTAGRRLFRNEGILASNGLLHAAALAAIQQAE